MNIFFIIREKYPCNLFLIEFLIVTKLIIYAYKFTGYQLDLLLGESKDLAFVITNDPYFSKKLCYHFDTQLGEGFVTKR